MESEEEGEVVEEVEEEWKEVRRHKKKPTVNTGLTQTTLEGFTCRKQTNNKADDSEEDEVANE